MSKLSYFVFFILLLSIISGQLIKLPFGTQSSATILDISTLILCLIGLLNIHSKKNIVANIKKTPLFIQAALVFGIVAVISLVISPLKLNFFDYIQSFLYTVRFLGFILLAWLFSKKALPIKNLNLILILSGFILAVLGLLQLIFIPNLGFLASDGWDPHYFRTVSTFLDPNFLGAYLDLTLLIVFLIPLKELSTIWRNIIFITIYLAIITTFSRSTALMLLISFAAAAILKKSLPIFLLTITLITGFGISFYIYSHTVAIPRNISRTKSAEFRLNSWEQGFGEFLRSPILGVGFNSYKYGLAQYELATEEQLKTRGSTSNDSSLLFVAATTGLIGLLSYLFFILSLFKTGFSNLKLKKNISIVFIAGITGLLINSSFINSLFYPFILVWITVVISQVVDS